MSGNHILSKLHIYTVTNHHQTLAVWFHNGCDVGCRDPSSFWRYDCSRSGISHLSPRNHPFNFGWRIGIGSGASQRHGIPYSRFSGTRNSDVGWRNWKKICVNVNIENNSWFAYIGQSCLFQL